MPLIPSNFAANSLSGTVRVSAGYANVVLTVSKYAFEDRTKTFTLKLRRDSTAGPVIAQSNLVTLTDFSEIVSLTANTSTVAEGNLVSFTLVTANVVDGANVFFSVLPVTANITTSDFFGANTGRVTINSNQGIFALYANADYSLVDETNETFKVQIRTVEPTGNVVFVSSNVAITDFFKRINVFRFEESASAVAEGSSVTFTVYAHNVTSGSLLYYYTSGNADISGSNTGSVVMNGVSNTITLTTASTVPGNQTRSFNLVLSGSNLGAPIATSNTISVADLALTSITATGGTVSLSGGYKIHQFTTSGNLTITGASPLTQMEYLAIAGGGSGGGGDMTFNAWGGSGGGAGGVLMGNLPAANAGNISVVIGAGGSGRNVTFPSYGGAGNNGSNTVLNLNLIAIGGGAGGNLFDSGRTGGSGGGGNHNNQAGLAGYPGQGNPGGTGQGQPSRGGSGGGGGYGSAGGNGSHFPPGQDYEGYSGMGGIGLLSSITGSNVQYAGGGGGSGSGGGYSANVGRYGGGNGLNTSAPPGPPLAAGSGNVNTGGGGGGISSWPQDTGYTITSGAGGSGIVVIRYLWQPLPFYTSVTANSSLVAEGSNAFFVVNTTFANASTLYYDTVGNVTSANFVNGNTGSFTITSNATVLRLQTVANIPTGETRNYQLRIREDSLTGNIVLVSSNLIIADGTNISNYISATGGTETLISGYKIHTFNTSGNLTISNAAVTPASNVIEYLVVAGGGAGGDRPPGAQAGGGGGAGGLKTGTYLANLGTFTMVIGAGGSGTPASPLYIGGPGSPSGIFSNTIVSTGGGGGSTGGGGVAAPEMAGGSGGGQGAGGGSGPGGPGVSGQGNPGGANNGAPVGYGAGGGGGAGSAGAGSPTSTGGDGIWSTISGSNVAYAGGGGGGQRNNPPGTGAAGGAGGGGKGGDVSTAGTPGTVNTGGGGGGAGQNVGPNGSGGSGIIVIRYPYIG